MINLTEKAWKDIVTVNDDVNLYIKFGSDLLIHGVPDHWDIGQRLDDCDGYALTKRDRLITLGYDWRDLRLCWCFSKQANGMSQGHLVLIVSTDRGDFVLDNLSAKVLPLAESPHHWYNIQDHNSSTGWSRCTNSLPQA